MLKPKRIFKEMYRAARLWANAQEIDLGAPIMVNTLPINEYPFMCWYYWVGITLYSIFVYEDGRIIFGFNNIDSRIEKEIRVA